MTRYGFISVTRARKGKGEHWQPVDSERLMVRHGLGAPRLTPGAFSGAATASAWFCAPLRGIPSAPRKHPPAETDSRLGGAG